MENLKKSISKYEKNNLNDTLKRDYIESLKENGYIFNEGKWIKDNYEISVSYSDGKLNINLNAK